MISWMQSQDKPSESGSKKRDELTNAIKTEMLGEGALPAEKIMYSDLNITASIKPYEEWGNHGYEVTIKNNEQLTEKGEVLTPVENTFKTAKAPKLSVQLATDERLSSGNEFTGEVTQKEGSNVATVDIGSVYAGRIIAPGATYKLKLKTTDASAAADHIAKIDLSQRMTKTGHVLGTQTIYGSGDPSENEAPVISGAEDKTIEVGRKFDPREGVTASDKEDGNLTSKIDVKGSVDTAKPGKYTLTYSVTDKGGQTTTKERIITVKEAKNEAPVISGAEDKTIEVGSKFDPREGVTASDKEDGNLTSKIDVKGSVDTAKPGKYTLTYSVTDKGGQTTTKERIITVKETATDAAGEMVNPINNVMVGYWHNWAQGSHDGYRQGSSASMNLDEINPAYNVVDVSFMKAESEGAIPTFKPYNMTDKEFRNQVSELNSQGKSVLLALGGADADVKLTTADEDAFVKEIIRQVDQYGFDGLDIDLEQGAITAGDNLTVIPNVLKKVKAHYKEQGKNFLITMATEFPNMRSGKGYENYINALTGYYDWINPQYYNQGADGVSVDGIGYLPQDNDNVKADFLYYLTKDIIEGKGFAQVPADKLVIGLPANKDAANNGYVVNPKDVYTAYARLNLDLTPLKGIMTWSVNWDNGKDSGGNNYNWEFANNYRDLLSGNPVPPVDTEAPTAPKNVKATEVTNNKVTLTWDKSTDNVAVKKYQVYRNGEKIKTTKETTFTDTTVAADKDYSYFVKAVDTSQLESAESEKVSVHTKPDSGSKPDTEAPSTPKNLRVTNVSPTEISFTWDASTDNEGVAGYKIYGNAGTVIADVKTNSFTHTNLLPNTLYAYTIVAYDKENNRSASSKYLFQVTPNKPETGDYPAWDSTKSYKAGERVTYNGKNYEAKWVADPGALPDHGGAWKELVPPGTVPEWSPYMAYDGGAVVSYKNRIYRAKWYANPGDEPGKDPWKDITDMAK